MTETTTNPQQLFFTESTHPVPSKGRPRGTELRTALPVSVDRCRNERGQSEMVQQLSTTVSKGRGDRL